MRKVTYFGAKLRRVVNRSAPGQAKGHGTRDTGCCQTEADSDRVRETDEREDKEALHTLNNFWLIAFRPRPRLRHQKAAKWSRRRSVKCGQAKSATRRPTTDDDDDDDNRVDNATCLAVAKMKNLFNLLCFLPQPAI